MIGTYPYAPGYAAAMRGYGYGYVNTQWANSTQKKEKEVTFKLLN